MTFMKSPHPYVGISKSHRKIHASCYTDVMGGIEFTVIIFVIMLQM